MIMLDPSVAVDVVTFRHHVSAATAAKPGSDVTQPAMAALNLYRNGLLPEDLYVDWSSDDRWTMESVTRRLLNRLAETEDETPSGDWLVEIANELRFDDQEFYLQVARRAARSNDLALVQRAMGQAETLSRQIGMPFEPPTDLVDLRRGRTDRSDVAPDQASVGG